MPEPGAVPSLPVEDQIEIRRRRPDVFTFVSDGQRLPVWMQGVKWARRTSPAAGTDEGTSYVLVGKLLGRRVGSRYTLTEYRPPETFSCRMLSPSFSLEQTYTFEESGDVTRVRLTGQALPLGRLVLLGPLLGPALQRQVRTDLRRLKAVLERSPVHRTATGEPEANGRQGRVTRSSRWTTSWGTPSGRS